MKLEVSKLETCDRTRVRKVKPNPNSDLIQEYAEAYECGLIMEPLDVFKENGTERYIVVDGEHRLLALQRAGIKEVDVRLHKGDETDALDFAIDCNQAHGLRRTKADRYHAFCRIMETALKDKYRTNTDLSDKIGVSQRTIATYKAQWRESSGGNGAVRRKKDAAREQADKRTRSDLKSGVDDADLHHLEPAENKEKRSSSPPTSPSGSRQSWTAADDHGYKMLRSAWNRATEGARQKFMQEVWP